MNQTEGIPEIVAREKIYNFVKADGVGKSKQEVDELLVRGEDKAHPNLGPMYVFTGKLGEFWVTKKRGTVVRHNAPRRFEIDDAEAFIAEYLDRHIPDFSTRNFERIDYEMEDPLWKEKWIEKPAEGEVSVFENWVDITVNVDARGVQNFSFSDLRHVRKHPPGISEAQAKAILMERLPEGKILDLKLVEHTADGGDTWVTIWLAKVRPDPEGEMPLEIISLNADTGELVP